MTLTKDGGEMAKKRYTLRDWNTKEMIPGTTYYRTPEDAVLAARRADIKDALLTREELKS